jgi:hypothetical protein
MMGVRLFAVVLISIGLSACASGMKYAEFAPTLAAQSDDVGRIFFYRPSAFGAALRPDVMLNGDKVGEAISQGFFFVDRTPGEYQVVTATEVTRKASFVLEKGQTRYIRFSTSMGFFAGHVYGELVDNDVGEKEINDCKYTGAP